MPKRRRSPEADLQRAVCEYLDRALPFGWRYWHNYQNAPTVQAQARLKALGVKAGIPDLILAGPDRQMIAIELKSPQGPNVARSRGLVGLVHLLRLACGGGTLC
jgi:hypothetical protein